MRGATITTALPLTRKLFQSTHPVRGATVLIAIKLRLSREFQSTHPVRGATTIGSWVQKASEISIHAPRAGCDEMMDIPARMQSNFNPRTPCGVRRVKMVYVIIIKGFQSTHPVRGATGYVAKIMGAEVFQSTHPVRGATANLTVLPGQICAKGTKKSLFSRKNAQKRK